MGEMVKESLALAMDELRQQLDDPAHVARLEATRAERAAADQADRAKLWRERYRLLAPVKVAARAWEAEQTPAVIAVHEWLQNPRRHLVLRGGVGCGKSTAGCVAVKHWVDPTDMKFEPDFDPHPSLRIERHLQADVCWLRPDALVSAVLHDYDEKSPKLRKHIVIDDMGVETKSDFQVAMCDLLDREGHLLLITTNLTRIGARSRYDLRLIDRLNDTARVMELPEKSMRRQDGGF